MQSIYIESLLYTLSIFYKKVTTEDIKTQLEMLHKGTLKFLLQIFARTAAALIRCFSFFKSVRLGGELILSLYIPIKKMKSHPTSSGGSERLP